MGLRRASGTRAVLLALALSLTALPARAVIEAVGTSEAARRLASGGWLLMMRHAATEPGVGDPAGFRISDCGSQRQLSEAGREQARRVGAALREAGVRIDEVRSSQWCRCRETAELAFGRVSEWPALNSLFGGQGDEAAQNAELLAYARSLGSERNAMLVTHQVNIRLAMGSTTAPAEILAGRWQDGRLVPAFRFRPAEGGERSDASPAPAGHAPAFAAEGAGR